MFTKISFTACVSQKLTAHRQTISTMTKLCSMMAHFQKAFTLDARSLACFRVLLSLTLLFDVFVEYGPWVDEFLADGRVALCPRKSQRLLVPSLYLAASSDWWPRLLLAVEAVMAILLGIGLRTTFVAPCCLVLHHGLLTRCGGLMHGGDVLTILYLWEACWLPLDLRWSLASRFDRRRSSSEDKPASNVVTSCATGCLCLLWSQLYFLNGIGKAQGFEWRSGTALGMCLANLSTTSAFGKWVGHTSPASLLSFATRVVVATQMLPFVAVLSNWPLLRFFAAAVTFMMHASFLLVFNLGSFPYVGMAGAVAFLPAEVWRPLKLWPATFRSSVRSATRADTSTGDLATETCLAMFVSCVLLGSCFFGIIVWTSAAAVLAVLVVVGQCVASAGFVDVPRDTAGRDEDCQSGATGEEIGQRIVEVSVVASRVLNVLVCVAAVLGNSSVWPLSMSALELSQPLGAQLPVGLFSGNGGNPGVVSVWWAVLGTTVGEPNQMLDWFPFGDSGPAPRSPNLAQPSLVSSQYPTSRWEKALAAGAVKPERLAAWLCHRFAAHHLAAFQIVRLRTPQPGWPADRKVLWAHVCVADPDAPPLTRDWLRGDGESAHEDPVHGVFLPGAMVAETRRLLVRGMRVRFRDGFFPPESEHLWLSRGTLAEFVESNDGEPPARVRVIPHDVFMWVPWGILELVDDEERAHDLLQLRRRVHGQLLQYGTTGVRVRMLADFGPVRIGDSGTVLAVNEGQPPVKVSWEANADREAVEYWVHWSDIQVEDRL